MPPERCERSAKGSAVATEQEISDAYIYLSSRLLVLRQQQTDFQEGFQWNTLVHRKPGDVQWPNPNLDVAYSEAWVAVDENSCLMVSVPKITVNSANAYTVTFAKDQTPPVNGFWSLSIYNEHHFFVANAINRFSVGTKNKGLKRAADGSLTM